MFIEGGELNSHCLYTWLHNFGTTTFLKGSVALCFSFILGYESTAILKKKVLRFQVFQKITMEKILLNKNCYQKQVYVMPICNITYQLYLFLTKTT